MVEGIVETLDQFQTDNAIIGRTILGDGFAADIGGEGVKGVDAGGIENFVYTGNISRVIQARPSWRGGEGAYNGLSSLGLKAEPLMINCDLELGYRE